MPKGLWLASLEVGCARATGDFDFQDERATLIDLVLRFGSMGAVTPDPHPLFGSLTAEEWDRLMWKHLDHHLRQFGT